MKHSGWTFAAALGTVAAGVIVAGLAFLDSPGVSAQRGEARSATLAWIPESAGLVGHLDVKSLASSPLSEVWSREAKSREELGAVDEIREATGVDLWKDVESLTFSVALASPSRTAPPPDESRPRQPWGMALAGRFDTDRLVSKANAREGKANEESYQGKTIYRLQGDGDEVVAFALASDSLLLLGSPDYLRSMIDCGTGRTPSASGLVESWGYGDFANDAFWVAGKPNGAFDSVIGRAGGGPALRSFALSGRLETNLSLTARGKAADADAAQKLADALRGLVALGRLQQSSNPQMGGIADAVHIELAGDEIHVGLALPYETIRSFFDQRRKTMDR